MFIDLWQHSKTQRVYFEVRSPILMVPASTPTALSTFYREVLYVNDVLYAVAFSLYRTNQGEEWLYLFTRREALDLSPVEASALIEHVGNYGCDHYLHFKSFFENPPASSDPPTSGPA